MNEKQKKKLNTTTQLYRMRKLRRFGLNLLIDNKILRQQIKNDYFLRQAEKKEEFFTVSV